MGAAWKAALPASSSSAVRTLHARVAVNESWANTLDRTSRTAPGRAAGPGNLEWYYDDHPDAGIIGVDPERKLDEHTRNRLAESKRKAYYARLALKSAQSRARRKKAS